MPVRDADVVTLEVNGERYAGWTSIGVKRSLESVGGSFDLALTERWPEQPKDWPLVAGDGCRVLIGNDPVITGYIDKLSAQYDANSHEIKASGRDATGDLVDCSAPSQSMNNATLPDIARGMAGAFGIDVSDETEGDDSVDDYTRMPKRSVNEGESVFRHLERQALTDGRLLTTDGNGKLVITTAGKGGQSGTVLAMGSNILSASIDRDFSQSYSSVTVKGQVSAADLSQFDLSSASPSYTDKKTATPVPGGVNRHRPLVLVSETQADGERCRKRAENEQARRKGKEIKISITVQGWRQDDGSLWTINQMVQLVDPYLRADGWWLISEVAFQLDESGSITKLTLCSPEGYSPKGKKGKTAGANPYDLGLKK